MVLNTEAAVDDLSQLFMVANMKRITAGACLVLV